MGQAAPAFGMIGTLIGLVQMLADMSDPSSIGPAMAVALLTTLYGALIANVVCIPLADKLKMRSREEVMAMSICFEGVVSLSQGDNPNAIDQKLRAFLSPKTRDGRGAEKQPAPEPEGQTV
jgi:chemotaxis protein MotA